MPKESKKSLIIALSVIVLILCMSAYVYVRSGMYSGDSTSGESGTSLQGDQNFACSHPDYKKIALGDSKDEISEKFGIADYVVVNNHDEDGSEFGFNEELVNAIEYGWTYHLPDWEGGVSFYLSKEDIVVHKTCGGG